jgi:hypothetical protein
MAYDSAYAVKVCNALMRATTNASPKSSDGSPVIHAEEAIDALVFTAGRIAAGWPDIEQESNARRLAEHAAIKIVAGIRAQQASGKLPGKIVIDDPKTGTMQVGPEALGSRQRSLRARSRERKPNQEPELKRAPDSSVTPGRSGYPGEETNGTNSAFIAE